MEHLSKSPVFPTEIIELIIDHLQGDTDALMRISETSHTILHLCRRCLFRSVNLGGTSISNTFMDLVQYNPTVGQYVRELALHVNALDRQTDPSYWRPGDASNIPLLTQTPFVEKLSIHGCIPPPTSSWNFLCPTFQQPILNRIHSASLTELSIYSFEIPVTIFQSCVNLSSLTIIQVKDSGKTEPIDQARMSSCSPQPMTIPQLRSFELDISSDSFALALVHDRDSDGHPLIRFDGLKTLIVHCDRQQELQHVIEDIRKEAIGLETFACRGITEATQWPDFSRFSTLKTLKGQCSHPPSSGDLLLGLCEKLQVFPQPNTLETLDIEILMPALWDRKVISTQNEGGQLDVVLSHGFPRLHRVSINVVIPYHPRYPNLESSELREEVAAVRERFPWLNENAAVKFNFSTSLLFKWGHRIRLFFHPL